MSPLYNDCGLVITCMANSLHTDTNVKAGGCPSRKKALLVIGDLHGVSLMASVVAAMCWQWRHRKKEKSKESAQYTLYSERTL